MVPETTPLSTKCQLMPFHCVLTTKCFKFAVVIEIVLLTTCLI